MSLTRDDRLELETWLSARVAVARTAWIQARIKALADIRMATGMPEPDGTLMRLQAGARDEFAVYYAALAAHTNMILRGDIDSALLAEWRASRKKGMGAAGGGLSMRREA